MHISSVKPKSSWDYPYIASCVKSASTITLLAITTLGSAAVAYQNPQRWCLTTFSVLTTSLYLLPKVLRYGNETMIKTALLINLSALGSLMLGGIGGSSVSLSQFFWTSLKTYHFSTALFNVFLISGFLGYGVPCFQEALNKVYHYVNDPNWQHNFIYLKNQFHRLPEVGLGFLQTNFWHSFLLQLALFQPSLMLSLSSNSVLNYFQITPQQACWSMAIATFGKLTFEQFQTLVNHILQFINFQDLSLIEQENCQMRIKFALQTLDPKHHLLAIQLLLSYQIQLASKVFSEKQFLNLLLVDNLEITESAIHQFLSYINRWEVIQGKHEQVQAKIQQLEMQMEEESDFKESKEFDQMKQEVNHDFQELRSSVEKLYMQKRLWQGFTDLWDKNQHSFELANELVAILQNKELLLKIDQTYRSLFGKGTTQGENLSLADRIQLINNKSLQPEEEETSATMVLAEKYGFIQQDYANLQTWLNLDSPNELEDKMAEIGLAVEEDLYTHKILSRGEENLKDVISIKLHHYMIEALKHPLANRVKVQQEENVASTSYKIGEKVTRVVFYLMTSGLILAPVLMHPYVGATGFTVGICFFILKRFGVPGIDNVAEISTDYLLALPLGSTICSLLNRRAFSITPIRRESANTFVQADFFHRMRILNFQILLAFFISDFRIRMEDPVLGGFLQGIALANEIVNLV